MVSVCLQADAGELPLGKRSSGETGERSFEIKGHTRSKNKFPADNVTLPFFALRALVWSLSLHCSHAGGKAKCLWTHAERPATRQPYVTTRAAFQAG